MSRVRRPWATRGVTGLTLATVLAIAVSACSGADSSTSGPPANPTGANEAGEPSDAATTLSDLDTTALVVGRAPFCDAVEPAAVARALDIDPGNSSDEGSQVEPADATAYRSGQRIKIGDGVSDVVHEYGCRWTAAGSIAEAWVFAPPITRERAVRLARAVRGGCADSVNTVDGADGADSTGPAFGDPWGRCTSEQRRSARVAYGGLFGDAWVGCALTRAAGSTGDLDDRGQEWCAAVATGAAAAG